MNQFCVGLTLCVTFSAAQSLSAAEVVFLTTDAQKRPMPCRIHLKDAAGKPQRAPGLPFWRDHFVSPGKVRLDLPPGDYTFEIERGPEFRRVAGELSAGDAKKHELAFSLQRLTDLSKEGWYSGDLHVHRPVADIKLLMRAEDLDVAPVITWWNNRNLWKDRKLPTETVVRFDGNRYYDVMSGEDEREGGALMYYHLKSPLPITGSTREYPSPLKFVEMARKQPGVWIDVEKPFWWDVPVWLASGRIDSIGLANNHMCHSRMYENEAWGKPRDEKRLPPPRGNGMWTQEIYYHILNAGLRVPPSAGSASGVLPNPVGYNRVYVHTGKDFNYQNWWKGLKAGRSFVTNGPLLRVRANKELPGHVFQADAGESLKIDLQMELDTQDTIPAIEIIKNGRVERTVPFAQWKKTGRLPSLTFNKSGWFLVRTLTDNPRTFRFASTAPFYVEIGAEKRHISKRSVQFFLDWVHERQKRVGLKLKEADKLQEVLAHHKTAQKFWELQLQNANAE